MRMQRGHPIFGSIVLIAAFLAGAATLLGGVLVEIGRDVFAAIAMSALAVFLLIVRPIAQERKSSEQRLRLQIDRLVTTINNMSQGLLLFDAAGRLVVCNRRYVEMYGLAPDVVKPGCTLEELLQHRQDTGSFAGNVDQYRAAILRDLSAGHVTAGLFETSDGRSIRIVNQPMSSGGWVATHEDITEQTTVRKERDRSKAFADMVIENVPVTIFVKNANDRRFVLVNKACERDWGLPRSEIIGKTAYDIFPTAAADVINERDERLLQCPEPLYFEEHSIQMPDKGTRIVTSKRLLIRSADGKEQYLAGVVEDITDRKRAEERIARLAHYDSITDLPNRILFREQLEQALARVNRGERIAVLYLDLDQFKNVNDTLGHPVGDELLKAVAARLRGCLRENDAIGRLGGDEFAIVQSCVSEPHDVSTLANRIHEAIRVPYEVGSHRLVADTSIGIALAPDDGTDPDQLLKNADLAMYSAKANGRSTYRFFEAGMDARLKERRALELDLREAITRDGLELHYQPLVNLRDDRITGCEALLRWRHHARGMIPPMEFIPVAEETGLINQIGEWVLQTACAEATKWRDDLRIAVNVSAVQFKDGSLVQQVVGALAASGLAAHRLELELTESVLIRDDEATLLILHQLRKLGVRIVMDDFGTGYSSLNYLQRFPFDKLKIDRSFIKDISEPEGSVSIVHAVINIARSRDITTTAEGVETESQMQALRALGCTEMQGYLFSRPRPAAEIVKLLQPADAGAVAVA